jgi:hypothetical protein
MYQQVGVIKRLYYVIFTMAFLLVSLDNMRETLGRVHVGVQDLKGLNTRHYHKNKRGRMEE